MEREILPRLERRQRLAVVRFQIERADVLALAPFFGDGEFAEAVPDEFGLFHLTAAQPGFLDLQPQFFQSRASLLAVEIQPQQAPTSLHHQLEQQHRDENQAEGEAEFASGQRGQRVK